MGELAYSLALTLWHRHESEPQWMQNLGSNLPELIRRNLNRLVTSRGIPPLTPVLNSPVTDSVRQISSAELIRPEIVVVANFETDDYSTVVKCVCPKCHELVELPVEFAGQTASCPLCDAYLDVPELVGGRREVLVSQWNVRKKREDNWQQQGLSAKWLTYFICLAVVVGIPYLLVKNEIMPPHFILGCVLGAGCGIWFTLWANDLKSLEQRPPSSSSSDQ